MIERVVSILALRQIFHSLRRLILRQVMRNTTLNIWSTLICIQSQLQDLQRTQSPILFRLPLLASSPLRSEEDSGEAMGLVPVLASELVRLDLEIALLVSAHRGSVIAPIGPASGRQPEELG